MVGGHWSAPGDCRTSSDAEDEVRTHLPTRRRKFGDAVDETRRVHWSTTGGCRRMTIRFRFWPRAVTEQCRERHQVSCPHDPVLVALSACVPRWPDVRRHRDRRRSPLCRSQQRQRGEIHALQPSCSGAWHTSLRQQVRGTQGGSGIEETRPHREVGVGAEMCADFCSDARSDRYVVRKRRGLSIACANRCSKQVRLSSGSF
jgi:hypothetical protein